MIVHIVYHEKLDNTGVINGFIVEGETQFNEVSAVRYVRVNVGEFRSEPG